MNTHAIDMRAESAPRIPAAVRVHMRWLAAGLLGGFLVPFVLADRLALPRDLYYGIDALAVVAVLHSYRTDLFLPPHD